MGSGRGGGSGGRLGVDRPGEGVGELWVRPWQMFLETVEVEGCDVPRFEFLSDA